MHFIKRIEHPACQISLFSWNGKYIVKFEYNQLEQSYKISEMDITNADELEMIVNEAFIINVMQRFGDMAEDWFTRF